jgi:hypothetical protein
VVTRTALVAGSQMPGAPLAAVAVMVVRPRVSPRSRNDADCSARGTATTATSVAAKRPSATASATRSESPGALEVTTLDRAQKSPDCPSPITNTVSPVR